MKEYILTLKKYLPKDYLENISKYTNSQTSKNSLDYFTFILENIYRNLTYKISFYNNKYNYITKIIFKLNYKNEDNYLASVTSLDIDTYLKYYVDYLIKKIKSKRLCIILKTPIRINLYYIYVVDIITFASEFKKQKKDPDLKYKIHYTFYMLYDLTWEEFIEAMGEYGIYITGGPKNKAHILSMVELSLYIFLIVFEKDIDYNKVYKYNNKIWNKKEDNSKDKTKILMSLEERDKYKKNVKKILDIEREFWSYITNMGNHITHKDLTEYLSYKDIKKDSESITHKDTDTLIFTIKVESVKEDKINCLIKWTSCPVDNNMYDKLYELNNDKKIDDFIKKIKQNGEYECKNNIYIDNIYVWRKDPSILVNRCLKNNIYLNGGKSSKRHIFTNLDFTLCEYIIKHKMVDYAISFYEQKDKNIFIKTRSYEKIESKKEKGK